MRWIVRIVLIVVGIGLLGVGALVAIPSDRIATLATERLAAATGRSVDIRGGVRPQLFPTLGIRAGELVIGNPDWVEEGPMLEARALSVGVAWGPLLRGEIRLETAELDQPRIVLVRGADGAVSWDLGAGERVTQSGAGAEAAGEAAPEAGRTVRRLGLDRAEITDGALLYVDRAADRVIRLDGIGAVLAMPDPAGPAELTLALSSGGAEIAAEARIATAADFLAGEVSDAALSLGWPGGSAGFEGRAGLTPAIDGELTFEAEDLAPLLRLAGVAPPELPQGFGRDRIAVSGTLTLAPEGSLHLRGGQIALDENMLASELDLLFGPERPLLRGNVTAGNIGFATAEAISGGAGAGAGGGGAAAQGWSAAPIDASGLFALDTEIAVTVDALRAGPLALDLIAARIGTENGRSVVDVAHAGLFGGTLTGQFVLNGRGTFSARAEAELTDVALNPAVTTLAGFDRLQGSGSGRISVVAQGQSLAALMAGLDGDGEIALGQGAILGLDIAGMLRNLDPGFRGEGARTVYDAVTASFTVTDGMLANDDLALEAPWGGVTGRGTVDLGRQRLDYLVVPGVIRGESGAARVAVPVRIEGPWDNLRYAPDLEALADRELSEEIDALEDRAADELRDLVREELGVEIEEGASREEAIDQLEDAVGDRLQEELSEGLRRLFE